MTMPSIMMIKRHAKYPVPRCLRNLGFTFVLFCLLPDQAQGQTWLCNKEICHLDDLCKYWTDHQRRTYGRCSLEHLIQLEKKMGEELDRYYFPVRTALETKRAGLEQALSELSEASNRFVFIISLLEKINLNIGELNIRQAAWFSNLKNLLKQKPLSLQNICQEGAFAQFQAQLETMLKAVPDDREIRKTALRLLQIANQLRDEINNYLYVLEKAITVEHRKPLVEVIQNLREKLPDVERQVHFYQNLRARYVQHLLERYQYYYMQAANNRITCNISDEYRKLLNNPLVYGKVKQHVDGIGLKVDLLLRKHYSPMLALREVRVFEVLLKDIESNLTQLYITEDVRKEIEFLLKDGHRSIEIYRQSLPGDENKLKFYAQMRSTRVTQIIRKLGAEEAVICKELAEKISLSETPSESEMAFKEFIEQCD
jgi:hypothetical protein